MPGSGGPAERLKAEGLRASTWGNRRFARYLAHAHDYDKVIVVVDGGIRFGLPVLGSGIGLAVGDRLELPAGTRHDAAVGPAGVTCLEAHLPAGTFAEARRIAAGEW